MYPEPVVGVGCACISFPGPDQHAIRADQPEYRIPSHRDAKVLQKTIIEFLVKLYAAGPGQFLSDLNYPLE
ncbi:hypothetical protein ASE92_08335 [Pedobacter sp. Leaf41]|nr:hypothetical protein ASE92_08335 [Pedobacter sp. Leaf41]